MLLSLFVTLFTRSRRPNLGHARPVCIYTCCWLTVLIWAVVLTSCNAREEAARIQIGRCVKKNQHWRGAGGRASAHCTPVQMLEATATSCGAWQSLASRQPRAPRVYTPCRHRRADPTCHMRACSLLLHWYSKCSAPTHPHSSLHLKKKKEKRTTANAQNGIVLRWTCTSLFRRGTSPPPPVVEFRFLGVLRAAAHRRNFVRVGEEREDRKKKEKKRFGWKAVSNHPGEV